VKKVVFFLAKKKIATDTRKPLETSIPTKGLGLENAEGHGHHLQVRRASAVP
jgi:hypothetical protein